MGETGYPVFTAALGRARALRQINNIASGSRPRGEGVYTQEAAAEGGRECAGRAQRVVRRSPQKWRVCLIHNLGARRPPTV